MKKTVLRYYNEKIKLRIILQVFIFITLLTGSLTLAVEPQAGGPLSWPKINNQMKPWTWWWWPGSAVDSANIARQLKIFSKAGLGGVQIIPIYGVKGREAHYIKFLSPEWMKMMGLTVAEARRLGMGTDIALESGWNFGGPFSKGNYANAFAVAKTFNISGGEEFIDTVSTGTQALMAFGPAGRVVDLTGKIGAGGNVDWTAPEGKWKVYAVSQRFSGQFVKRASNGSDGPMLNPFYAPAMKRYVQRFDKAFKITADRCRMQFSRTLTNINAIGLLISSLNSKNSEDINCRMFFLFFSMPIPLKKRLALSLITAEQFPT